MSTGQKEWTVMIYMSGENNLSIDMAYAVENIRRTMKLDAGINLFVYFDGATSGVPTLYCDFSDIKSGGKIYEARRQVRLHPTGERRNQGTWEALNGDENSSAVESIANFVDWCVNRAPFEEDGKKKKGRRANRYALIFSGHSTGIFREGFLKDEASNYALSFNRLRFILDRITMKKDELLSYEKNRANDKGYEFKKSSERFKQYGTEILGQPFDLLGFDSCLMSMVEVAYQFRNSCKTMIASEGSIPAAGWSYAEILNCLASRTALDTKEAAKDFVRQFILKQDRHTLGGVNVDIAAWDLTRFKANKDDPKQEEPFVAEFTAFSEALLACLDDPDSSSYSALRRIVTYVHWRCQSYLFEQNVDLVDFCTLLSKEIDLMKKEGVKLTAEIEKVKETAIALADVVKSVILAHGFSGGKYQYSNGAALFFPWSLTTFLEAFRGYQKLDITRKQAGKNGWVEFLWKFVSQVTLRPSIEFEGKFTDVGALYYNHTFGETASVGSLDAKRVKAQIKKAGRDRTEIDPKVSKSISLDSAGSIVRTDVNTRVDRTPLNPALDRTPINPALDRSQFDDDSRSEIAPKIDRGLTNKIPDNAASKMFGTTGQMIQSIMEWKNIQTFWDVSGLSTLPEGDYSKDERATTPEP